MNPRYRFVADRAGHRCEYCHAPEVVFNFQLEVEHIIPVARNGPDDVSNLALACHACNLYKGAFILGVDVLSDASISLFNPRQDSWSEHFQIDIETCEMKGLTAIGRATITRLQLNHPGQISARQLWLRLGIFP